MIHGLTHAFPTRRTSDLPDGQAYSKGKVDMCVVLDPGREHYLAYECKRLNVQHNGSRHSRATRYVTEGVTRFVTEQYAADLPTGCMLGYVLDGDPDRQRTRLNSSH